MYLPNGNESSGYPWQHFIERSVRRAVVKEHNVIEAMHLVVGHPLAEEALLITEHGAENGLRSRLFADLFIASSAVGEVLVVGILLYILHR